MLKNFANFFQLNRAHDDPTGGNPEQSLRMWHRQSEQNEMDMQPGFSTTPCAQ
jgi:hypothetical protein